MYRKKEKMRAMMFRAFTLCLFILPCSYLFLYTYALTPPESQTYLPVDITNEDQFTDDIKRVDDFAANVLDVLHNPSVIIENRDIVNAFEIEKGIISDADNKGTVGEVDDTLTIDNVVNTEDVDDVKIKGGDDKVSEDNTNSDGFEIDKVENTQHKEDTNSAKETIDTIIANNVVNTVAVTESTQKVDEVVYIDKEDKVEKKGLENTESADNNVETEEGDINNEEKEESVEEVIVDNPLDNLSEDEMVDAVEIERGNDEEYGSSEGVEIVVDDVADKVEVVDVVVENVEPETGFYSICPSLKGTTILNNTKEWDEKMMIQKVNETIDKLNSYCQFNKNTPSSILSSVVRTACYVGLDNEYGIDEIDPAHYFPDLSFTSPVSISDQISPRFKEKDNSTVRVAYLLLVHSNFNQIVKLLSATYHPNNVYLIHVDASALELKNQLLEYTNKFDNIAVMRKSFPIQWGSISMVYATLEGLFTLLDAAKFDFVVNLSGQDYPTCSPDEFSQFLGKHMKANFDGAYRASAEHGVYRLENIWLWNEWRRTCNPKFLLKKYPAGMTMYGTMQWFAYNYDFVQYLRNNQTSQRLLAFYETALIPDEGYFGTVLMNSPFGKDYIRNSLHHVVFVENSIHPNTLETEEDFQSITNPKLHVCFARKFDWNSSQELMSKIDDWLLHKEKKDFLGERWLV
eukprot:TRINITY_DN8430_c0_g1_i1.p1 TRINITY_DN8430_c0_g1~~TRINITY_DN8430_c0_g1_i1.p1  ORF type:complete len:686 (-),score=152.88 TRINITY_DN8430_c0_g1_i1:8-2065(-)